MYSIVSRERCHRDRADHYYGCNALQHYLAMNGKSPEMALLLFAAGETLYHKEDVSLIEKIVPELHGTLRPKPRLDQAAEL